MSLPRFVAFTLRRRVTVLMLAAATVLVGTITWFLIPIELVPRGFSDAEVSIWIPVPSSNPMEVQEQVIRPAEEQIRTIPGITELSSRARADSARIRVAFSREVDLDLSVAELRDRLERARAAWPEQVRDYRIFRFNMDTDVPILSFALDLEREREPEELTFVIEEKVLKPLEAQPGVARVTVWGLLDDQVHVSVDWNRALAQGVGIYELTQLLSASNLEVAGGTIEEGGLRFAVRTDARFRSVEDLRRMPIDRNGLELGQIATVEPRKSVREFMALSRNQRSLWCQVYKESAANTVETADRVRAMLREKIAGDPALAGVGAKLRFYPRADVGLLITGALDTLTESAVVGAVLAVLVLFAFLRRLAPTLIITTAIPLSLLLTLAWIHFSGASLNILSMLGLTIAVGMLVDNAIVVVENIARHRDLGAAPLEAARRGAAEVALAIALSTLTTVAAFLPVIFMSGDHEISFLAGGIGLPLCVAVLSSLLVAIVFVPLGTVALWPRRARPASAAPPGTSRLHALHARALEGALRNRFFTVLAIGGAIALLTWQAWEHLPKVDMLSEAGGRLGIEVELDRNFTLEDAYEAMTTLGRWMDERAATYEIEHFWCFFRKDGGEFIVDLSHQDMVATKATAERLRQELPRLPGVRLGLGVDDRSSDERGKPTVDLFGPDPQRLVQLSRELSERLGRVPGVLSVRSDLEEAEEEVHIRPDRERTALFGVDPRGLRGTIEYGLRGWRFSDLILGEREVPLVIEFEGADDRDLPELRDLPVLARTERRVPLSSVASIEVRQGFGEIQRQDGQARAHLTIEAGGEDAVGVRERLREAIRGFPLPEGYSFSEGGADEMAAAQREMRGALILSVTFVFLLMGILFESFVLPLAVLVTIPFSWAGAVFGLALTGTPLDFVGSIGVLILVGVVVNNGIVYIDCAHRLQAEGRDRTAALVEAGRTRLRPILMTAITTVVGLLPMATLDSGGSQISYKALSRAVIGGLIVSTLFTLLFVPILYSLFDDLRRIFGGRPAD